MICKQCFVTKEIHTEIGILIQDAALFKTVVRKWHFELKRGHQVTMIFMCSHFTSGVENRNSLSKDAAFLLKLSMNFDNYSF